MSCAETYKFDCIFCGASFAAAGAAAKLADGGKRVLLIDPAGLPGSEFALSYLGCRTCGGAENELSRELHARGALTGEGIIEPAALVPVLSHILRRREGISYFPQSVLTAAEKTADGWRVEFVTNGVNHSAEAARLVSADLYDTVGGCANSHIKKKYLIGLAVGESGGIAECDLGGCRVRRGASDGDAMLEFEFAPETDMRTARREVRRRIAGGVLDGTSLRMAALGEEFAVISDEESAVYSNGYARLAPVTCGDAVSAYGHGALFAEQLDGAVTDSSLPTCGGCDASGEYDLIVAGLGAAGSIAAITAARLGLRVIGLEKGSQPGGVGTSGGIHSYYLGYSGGLYCEADEIASRLQERGFIRERGCGLLTKGMALDMLLEKSGADVIYGASVCGVLRDENDPARIIGVVYRDSSGMHSVRAPLTVDATADATVSLLAGCTMQGGRESDGDLQLFSSVSRFLNRETGCTASKNQDDGLVDQYDPVDLGKKTLESAASTLNLKGDYRGGRYRRLGTVSYLGVREGRRIVGMDTMTMARAAECRPESAVFWELANLDSHAKDLPFESRAYRDVVELCSLWDCRISIPVTKECLIPAGVRGLIAAGRNISMDHDIALACRMMRAMQKCGEAVGVIAYLAHRDGAEPCALSDSELHAMLEERGVISPGTHFGMYFYTDDPETRYKKDLLELNAGELAEMLASDAPGAAVYACSVNRKLGNKELVHMLGVPASRRGAALALAVRGENAAARQALIGMIRDRSGEMPRSSHTFCVPYAVSAMSAAGRCGMTEALPALLDIVCDPDYACDIPNLDTVDDKTKLLCDDDDVKYIYFAAALGALGDIFRLHPDEVRRAVRGREKPDLSRYVTGASMIGRTDGVRNSSEKNMRRVIDEVWG